VNSLATIRKLVTVEELAALQNLELVAARVVEGILTGTHRSKMKGGSSEFAEHRAYSAGDEVRRLDWRVVAKSDRYYIKQYHEESSLGVVLVLDASGSMAYGDSTRSKFLHARAAAACLSRLVLGQRDPVGLAVAQRKASTFLPARSSAGHLLGLLDSLLKTEAKGRNDLLSTLDWLIRNLRRRSQFVLLTDGFVELDILEKLLLALAARGHQLLLLHVLAPEELTFSFKENSRFQCLETLDEIDVDPIVFADTYLSRLQAFVDRLRRICLRAGGDYEPMRTDQPLGTVLGDYLRRRMRRSRRYAAPRAR
jgi:uncharacterized protein (DUF58 family)